MDIRGFFTAKREINKKPDPQVAKSDEAPTKINTPKRLPKIVDDDFVVSSDDEEQPEKKRQKLSKGKAAKTPKKDHSNTPTEKSCSKNSSSESLDVDTSSSSVSVESSTVSISSPSGAMVAPVVHIVNELLNTKTKPTIDTTEVSKKLLPVLDSKTVVEGAKSVKKEIKAVSSYFGEPESSNELSVVDDSSLKKPHKLTNSPAKELKSHLPSSSSSAMSSASTSTSASTIVPTKAETVSSVKKSDIIDISSQGGDDLDDALIEVTESIGAKRKASDTSSMTSSTTTLTPSKVRKTATNLSSQATSKGSAATTDTEGSLDDVKFVITGVLSSMSREELEETLKSLGAKVTTAVSGRTDYLIAGNVLEDGRDVSESSKYRNAKEKKVSILTEDDIISMISKAQSIKASSSCNSGSTPSSSSSASSSSSVSSISSINAIGGDSSSNSTPSRLSSSVIKTSATMPTPVARLKGIEEDKACELMWVDKYKPQRISDIIGSSDTIKKLMDWLRQWKAVHIDKSYKPSFTKENPGAKAALLSGPPGIGKTTIATVIAKELGYEILELNASDTRNKKSVSEILTPAVVSMAISFQSSGSTSSMKQDLPSLHMSKRLVIMDEVDGMGGSDRGGLAELSKIIKASKVPIICMCNDRQSSKIRNFANSCYDLRLKRPLKTQIAHRMVDIAAKEGLQLEPNAAEILVEQSGNDIRQVLHALQMWSLTNNKASYLEMKSEMHRIEKDKVLRQTPFDACLGILGGSKTPLDDRFGSFFIDYSLVPLLVQQNYIESSKHGVFKNPSLNDAERMDRLWQSSESISDMDLVSSLIRGSDPHWELLPSQAMLAVKAGHSVQGFQAFPSFPEWLGKYSTTSKMQRLTKELVFHTSISIDQTFGSMLLDYVPFLRKRLLFALLHEFPEEKIAVEQVVKMLDDYGLNKEDFMETLKDMQFLINGDSMLKDGFEKIDSKLKAQLTRYYNSVEHTSPALVEVLAAVKKRKAANYGDENEDGTYDEEGGEEGDSNEKKKDIENDNQVEEDDDIDISVFKAKKKPAKKASTPSTATSGSRKGKK